MPSSEDAMENQHCSVLLVCCVQVTPESVDVYMYPPSTTAASFCMRMIGWERHVSSSSMVLHVLAIGPTRRVADRQTTALNVRGQRGLHTRAHRKAYDGHRRRSCRR